MFRYLRENRCRLLGCSLVVFLHFLMIAVISLLLWNVSPTLAYGRVEYGVVIFVDDSYDLVVIETDAGCVVGELYGSYLDEGHTVVGELSSYGVQTIIDLDTKQKVDVDIDDYGLSRDAASKWILEHRP